MACTWFFLIFCSPRLAKTSLPFRGSASVEGNQKHLKTTSLDTFLILKFQLSYLSLHSKSPTLLAEPCSRRVILPKETKHYCTTYRRTSCGHWKIWRHLQTRISKSHPWFSTPHPASCCSCQISKVWELPRNDITNSIFPKLSLIDITVTRSPGITDWICAIQKVKFAILLTSRLQLSSALYQVCRKCN